MRSWLFTAVTAFALASTGLGWPARGAAQLEPEPAEPPQATLEAAEPAELAQDAVRYALVIGANSGGPGQERLRYAQDDAGRVADLLATLGGYPAEHIERLLAPTAAELLSALERVRAQLAAHADRGEKSRFFFYYSGHARADALNLGEEQVALSELRARVLSLPATVSLVVLDACQSGAFSRVKGASPAADFSWNSVQRLDTEGVAVIASSTGVELSQESDELRSSYFTHHLLVSLRGAGDQNDDGRVTLSEAYQYAYNRTLTATAVTAVGEQHATLETSFKGKGELELTRPGKADARLRIPSELSGRVLVQRLPSHSPLAEVQKASGQPLELALPAGRYLATLRQGGWVVRCAFELPRGQSTLLSTAGCSRAPLVSAQVKGGERPPSVATRKQPPAPSGEEGVIFEALLGHAATRDSGTYERRLEAFDFGRVDKINTRYSLALGYRLQRHFVAGLWYYNLDGAAYGREEGSAPQGFTWDSRALGAFGQADVGFGPLRRLTLFVRGGGGVAFATTKLDAIEAESTFADQDPSFEDRTATTRRVEDAFTGYFLALGVGFHVMPFEYFGLSFEARYTLSPLIDNALGETHDAGGLAILLGLRVRSWE